MRRQICTQLTLALLFIFPALAQNVPPQLQPPAGEQLFLTVHAKGDQVYTCKEGVTQFDWVLKAPDAQLFDKDGKPFGKHFAGPTWEATDGSRVTGKAVANAPSPDSESVPWLLVRVVGHEGNGVLSRYQHPTHQHQRRQTPRLRLRLHPHWPGSSHPLLRRLPLPRPAKVNPVSNNLFSRVPPRMPPLHVGS